MNINELKLDALKRMDEIKAKYATPVNPTRDKLKAFCWDLVKYLPQESVPSDIYIPSDEYDLAFGEPTSDKQDYPTVWALWICGHKYITFRKRV